MARGIALEESEKKKLNKENLAKLKDIFKFFLPYKNVFTAGLLALVLSSLTTLSFPYFFGKLLDIAQGKTGVSVGLVTLNSIGAIAWMLLGILCLQAIFSFIRVYTFSVVSEKALADLRLALYRKIIWLPQTFFDTHRTGDLISRITLDVATLQDTFTVTIAELLRQLLTLLVGTALLLIITPRLTVFMLLTFPVIVVAALFFGRYIRKLSKRTQDQLGITNVIVEETLQSIAVVKSFTNELYEILRYRKSIAQAVTIALRTAKYRGLFISFSIFMLFGGIVAVAWYGASLVQQQLITVGDLLTFILYTSFIGASVAGLGDIYTQLQRSIGISERLQEILSQEDESTVESKSLKLSGDLRFNDVSFAYPSRPDVTVLKHVTFTISPGEKIALVGPSGSGKSTLANLLMRFYPLQTGSITADDTNISSYALSDYRTNIGIVAQEVMLFGGTIRENVAYGKPGSSDHEIREACRKANALEFIDQFPEKLNTIVGERGVQLSGGQRQRIAIARAILKDPVILILDEATSALDSGSEKVVQDALEVLMENRTTIIIAHRLSTIRKADRILVFKDGIIAESGSHKDLSIVENGIYHNLLKLQTEIN